MNKKQKRVLARIIIASVLVVAGLFFDDKTVRLILFGASYLTVGYDILIKAFKGLYNRELLDENFLMTVASVGAFVLGEELEGAMVMLLYQVGELFQSYSVGKSRKNIAELMDIRPDYANLEGDNGEVEKVDPYDVPVGSVIVVKPGEKIPLDGVVIEGESAVDTVSLTGESVPRSLRKGDEALSGCINLSGVIRVRTEKEFGESSVSKILELVENASSNKAKSENMITRFARIYTPVVCGLALLLAVVPPLISLLSGNGNTFPTWIYRALTFLVISCPCALVISVPLTFFASIGGASACGILIKGSNCFETLADVRCVVMDKTGTLTKGAFEVTGIHHSALERELLLYYASHAEMFSTHPIAKSITDSYGKKTDKERVKDVREISGEGVIANIDGKEVAVGNEKLMKRTGASYVECSQVGTVVHVSIDGEYAGHILISDVIKESSAIAVAKMKKYGVSKTVMLTGDRENVASDVASKVGIEEYYCELLPTGKVEKLDGIKSSLGTKEKLAFVGDGINDAPVLSRADIGIAMGGLGSDAAIESADVVIMDDDPSKIAKAIGIAKKCIRIVYENIIFALAVKFVCLVLGALGIADMWLAIFADVGVMILVVINAMRAMYVKKI